MRRSRRFPDYEDLLDFHQRLAREEFSYPHVGATRDSYPHGYDHDFNQVYLGSGQEASDRARAALRRWGMFPPRWTRIFPANHSQDPGTEVVVLIHLLGWWWANGARIIYRVEEENRYGFAYGTLWSHVEQGEEVFMVHRDDFGHVYYTVSAFSQPRYWLARGVYPFARFQQRRFVHQSLAHMHRLVNEQPLVTVG